MTFLSACAALAVAVALGWASPAQAVLEQPDLCGGIDVGQSTHQLGPGIGDGTSGKLFLCGQPNSDMPPYLEFTPDQDAPDPIDPNGNFFNYAYIIGPNGAAASWAGISGNQIIVAAIEGLGEGIAVDIFAAWAFPPLTWAAAVGAAVASATANVLVNVANQFYDAYEDMSASDWDFYVPSNWHGWIFWDGLGEVETISIDPHIVNQYFYNLQDYVSGDPDAYIRLYVGISQRPTSQGDGIVDDAWTANANGAPPFASGVDRVSGRAGVARVGLRAGNQRVTGSSRNDELSARVGNDALLGLAGDDQLGAGPGDDVLLGGPGSDELRAFDGDDQLRGGPGHDLLLGGPGADALVGGSGGDVLSDGPGRRSGGRSLLVGGAGRDFLIARDGRGDDELQCGSGRDVAVADRGDRVSADCELVLRRRPPRGTRPPRLGHPVGRPPGAVQPEWRMATLMRSHEVRSRAGRGHAPLYSAALAAELQEAGR